MICHCEECGGEAISPQIASYGFNLNGLLRLGQQADIFYFKFVAYYPTHSNWAENPDYSLL
jgi:hypothetical protein